MKNLKILTGTFLITLLLTANSFSVNAAQKTNRLVNSTTQPFKSHVANPTIPPMVSLFKAYKELEKLYSTYSSCDTAQKELLKEASEALREAKEKLKTLEEKETNEEEYLRLRRKLEKSRGKIWAEEECR